MNHEIDMLESLEPRRLLAGVTGLYLVDADTGRDIMPLRGRATLNLAMLPTRDLAVRAAATGDTAAVRFAVDGKPKVSVGASPGPAGGVGAVNSGLPGSGVHTISATALRQVRGGALRGGGSRSVKLTIIDAPVVDPNGGGPQTGGNWSLAFADEFDGGSLAPATWAGTLWGLNRWSDEAQVYDPGGATVSDGVLSLTAQRNTWVGVNRPYVSGLASTGGTPTAAAAFAFQYGYAEARIQVPAGQGLWPAFWMLPTCDARGRYRDGEGEIDVMEFLGGQRTTDQVHVIRHGRKWGDGIGAGVDLSQDFHTYGISWEPNELTWYLDGRAIYTVTDPAAIPKAPEYLILNLAVGTNRSWPGAPNGATQFPATMQVDWVRVWRQ